MKYGTLTFLVAMVFIGVYGLLVQNTNHSTEAATAVVNDTKITDISVETSFAAGDIETKNANNDPEDEGDFVANKYTNEVYEFVFSYPDSAKVTEYTDEMLLVEGSNSGGLVDINVVTNEFRDVTNISALTYIEARLRCDADGTEGSVRCGEVVESEEYISEAGAVGEKFTLEKIVTDDIGRETISTYGPVYAFPISGNLEDASLGALIVAPPVGIEAEKNKLLTIVVSTLKL